MRYEIVELLKEAAPGFVSGQELGRRFEISRAAIWKHIEELRQEGYSIEAVPRKGYRLISSEDRLNSYEIANNLSTFIVGRKVEYFDTLDSTNNFAKKLAGEGCPDGTTIVAGQQIAGRGRMGRSWDSPANKGIYITVVLRPPMAPEETQILTLAAAVATAKGISAATGIGTGIKWPNDLVIEGRKVCGILVEMSSEADRVNHIVLGIGINYSQADDEFPDELKHRAISLRMASQNIKEGSTKEMSKLSVIRSVLRELDSCYQLVLNGKHKEILDMWKKNSVTIGREVRFTMGDVEYTGIATGITTDGRLSVDCTDGKRRDLLSGEVLVRGIYGYV